MRRVAILPTLARESRPAGTDSASTATSSRPTSARTEPLCAPGPGDPVHRRCVVDLVSAFGGVTTAAGGSASESGGETIDSPEGILPGPRLASGRCLASGPAAGLPRPPASLWRRLEARLVARVLVIPSVGTAAERRRVRLLALVAVRDEMSYLPGFLANVAPHVDGIVALDDGSADGSAELLAACPDVLEVLRVPRSRPAWDEVGNYKRLHAAALRHAAEWLVVVDADERVERRFRDRAERVIRRGQRLGLSAFAVRLRELWGSSATFRCDGIWGAKRVARLFAALPDHQFDEQPLHAVKGPLQASICGRFVTADLQLYHLRTIRRADREARRSRYGRLDPEARWQPGIGYDYLTDETGLRLRRVSARRGFVEGTGPGAA